MAFTTSRRSVLMLLLTPGLALLSSGNIRATAQTAIPAEAARGRWGPVFDLPNVAIHTHVLPNGKVLFWGRRSHPNGSMHEQGCAPYVWDPRTGQLTATPQPTRADGTKINLFCSGHAFLPDGRLLVVGGHLTDGDGLDQACVYDYRTKSWAALPVMNQRRWYPITTALPDGTVLVSSGSYKQNGRVVLNDNPQIWNGRRWTPAAAFTGLPPYGRIHVAPSGQVLAMPHPRGHHEYSPAVMYDTGKVISIGGSSDHAPEVPVAAAAVIDQRAGRPAWRDIAGMHFPRRQHNATILADGTVLVTGGTSGPGFNDLSPGKPVHVAELWEPATEQWTALAAEEVDRCYHSTAVLLPDATVLSAGGGEFVAGSRPNDPRDSHRNAQIFHPPYLFRGPRPEIRSAPAEVTYGETFRLAVSGPDVGKITWIRLPSMAHALDHSQRINVLNFRRHDHGVIVDAPEEPRTCLPGHYMLFALSKAGVPSVARIVRIDLPC